MEYLIVSGPVIIENNKILLNKDEKDDFWKIVGGKAQEGETLEETAKREAKEEMGIDIKIIRPMNSMVLWKKDKAIVLIHYLAKRIGEVKPGPETSDWKWIDINNLPKEVAPNVTMVVQEWKETESRDKE